MSETNVRFTLERNNFKKGNYYGYVVPNANAEIRAIIGCIVPWIHPDDISDVMDHLGREVLRNLRSGNRVSFGDFLTFEPAIEGSFCGEDDVYDPSRHSLGVKVLPGGLLRDLDRKERVKIKKVKGIRR